MIEEQIKREMTIGCAGMMGIFDQAPHSLLFPPFNKYFTVDCLNKLWMRRGRKIFDAPVRVVFAQWDKS